MKQNRFWYFPYNPNGYDVLRAFIATWLPYNRGEYCLEYLKDSPHLERLRRINEF